MLTLARSSLASLTSRSQLRVRTFASWQKRYPNFLKSNSVRLVRDCRAQIEFVIAYRIRRGLQFLILYSKLGEDYALWRCFQLVKRYFVQYSKVAGVSLSAAIFKYNWAEERIRDDEIARHFQDVDICHRLKEKVEVNAPPCTDLIPSDPEDFLKFLMSEKCWVPFVTLENLTIWKKQNSEDQSRTLCCYKIYGYFDDVRALSFLQAYLDLDTRRTWDQHVLRLEVVESEPESNSDLIYWISKWPKMFANRDYVYKRRYIIDPKKQVIAVASKAASHPQFPPTKSNWRVEKYWSYLIVKPYRKFEDKGLEFSLTYYDDPGSNLPGSMLIWATVHGMPTYFNRLHQETLKIERTAVPIDFQKTDFIPQDEVDPYEGYVTDDDDVIDDHPITVVTKTENSSHPVLQNVPFQLPPPTDPNKPKVLPRQLSQEEFLRSWNVIKLKIKESVDKVNDQFEEIAQPSESYSDDVGPVQNEDPSTSSATSMFLDPFFGTYIVKASELGDTLKFGHNSYECNSDGSLILLTPDRNVIIDAILELKRVICKILFDRIWR